MINSNSFSIQTILPSIIQQQKVTNDQVTVDHESFNNNHSFPLPSQNHSLTNEYLLNLNRGIADFDQMAKSIENGEASQVKLPPSLYSNLLERLLAMSHSYRMSLEDMQLSENMTKEQLMPLFLSTFFISEIQKMQKDTHSHVWDKLKVYYKSPNTCLTLLFLVKFLESQDKLDFHKTIFKKLISKCANLLFIFRIASYLTAHEKLIHSVIKTYIKNLIRELKPMESIALPGGWLNNAQKGVEGHFMIYVLQRENESTLIKTRINTHPILGNLDTKEQIIKTEKLEEKDLDQFIFEIINLLLKQSFLDKISTMADEERVKRLYHIGMHPENSKSDLLSHSIHLEPQHEAFNCCFMACFALYQYIHITYRNHETVKFQINCKENQDFLLFRENFKNYIKNHPNLML